MAFNDVGMSLLDRDRNVVYNDLEIGIIFTAHVQCFWLHTNGKLMFSFLRFKSSHYAAKQALHALKLRAEYELFPASLQVRQARQLIGDCPPCQGHWRPPCAGGAGIEEDRRGGQSALPAIGPGSAQEILTERYGRLAVPCVCVFCTTAIDA